jgi:adenylate cyclase class IV
VQKDKQRFFVEVDNVENLDTFYEYEFGISDINVEGRLNKSVEFWEQIGTSKFILDVIKKVIQSHYYTNPRKHF